MAIQGINSTNSQSSVPAQQTSKPTLTGKTVTQDEFLKLLIAQLQNQDPLQPMDNQQFAVQLATFNSLEQLIGINDKLGGLNSAQGATNQFNATSLIGKEVATTGNTLSLQSGSPAAINYQLGSNATKVVVNVQDASGALVRQIQVGAQNVGDQSVVWDGKDAAGKAARSGLYNFEVNAFDINGRQVSASGRTQGVVTGVRLDGSEPVLEIGTLQVPLSAVTSVRPRS
jgi:flagellar basal-body rod modification protein FlgD